MSLYEYPTTWIKPDPADRSADLSERWHLKPEGCGHPYRTCPCYCDNCDNEIRNCPCYCLRCGGSLHSMCPCTTPQPTHDDPD